MSATAPMMSSEGQTFVSHCRRFAEEVIAPHAAKYDQENRFPEAVHEAAYQRGGIIGVDLPTAYGGGGLSDVDAVAGAETLATVCAPTAFTLGFNRGALHPVLAAGTLEQKERFIAELLAQRGYASLCLTEPEISGSNLLGLQTTARRTASGWVINGTKCMVGQGSVASLYLVLARTEVDGVSRGPSFFAVPRTEAVQVGPNTDKLGFRCVETPEVRFLDAEVGDEYRIGAMGSGAELMLDTLAAIRVGGASVILGIVIGALQEVVPWLEGREVYGGPLIQKSHVQLELGGFFARALSIRTTIRKAALARQQGLPYGTDAAVAKLQAATLAVEATSRIAQLYGWRGIDGDYPIQKRFRDARQTPIFEGTSEVQKLNLFREMRRRLAEDGKL